MNRSMPAVARFALLAALLVLPGIRHCRAAQPAQTPPADPQHHLDARLWFANWDGDFDNGDSFDIGAGYMLLAQYTYLFPAFPVSVYAQAGRGTGWEDDSRDDLLAGIAWWHRYLQVGLNYHQIRKENDAGDGWVATFAGPELLAAATIRLSPQFAAVLVATWMPVVSWQADQSGAYAFSNDGTTSAYGYEISLVWRKDAVRLRAGYRAQRIHADSGDAVPGLPGWAHADIANDEFRGPFIAAGLAL
ncbi:MAG: hypothetical protein JXR37_30085 [Kiritimatiellae bacterium]|nr:hypothetical protein [Kiritimatiellia bacterium]